VLLPENLLNILARFVHLQIEDKESYEGRKYKKETLIFPRYHQWDVVRKLIGSASSEGPGQKYLVQHSAGSGKSNSIAWTAHQLSSLHRSNGNKLFASVIVVTDRTVLDDQLQDTIYQFDHQDGVVGRISNKDGNGSKLEKLAHALELFGRLPHPDAAPSKQNKPEAFHVYSMRQAIEEVFILDVLQNYTNYAVAYRLAQTVDKKKARVKLNQWMRLHDYNISQKVMVIMEHFRDNVQQLLNGQAKAMVAFSGEVEFNISDPNATALLGNSYTESSMNPGLKGRDMRKAFNSEDYQVMIVANKFQTGFDQPKLCAMYVDKKLGGVECVQTLSRLNRTYPTKAVTGTYILDFFNDPQDILDSFLPYYQTAELLDVSDPNQIMDLFEKHYLKILQN